MAYNFPDSPSYNTTFGAYKWDGEKWILAAGGIGMPNPPSSPRTAIISPAWTGLGASIFYDSGAGVTRII
jgi:hypothetical protein